MSVLGTPSPALAAPVPGTSCRVLPADNIWNTDISKLPVDSHNATWLRAMHAGSTLLHPDFGRAPYGFPFVVVGNAFPLRHIRFHYASESDRGPYPFGKHTPIEGGQRSSGDRHALMINRDTCTLFELYAAYWNGGSPKAGSGAIFHLGSNALRTDGWTSADAAGLPIFPGLVRYDEVAKGAIRHAIRFTADCTSGRHVWPARHDAATGGSKCPPMGARFRLRAGYDTSHYGPKARVILRAMKHYGMIVADNGTDWYFQGTKDSRWTDALLDQLKRIPASKFEAVDTSSCMVKRSSGTADC
jgi:hypothetical protein